MPEAIGTVEAIRRDGKGFKLDDGEWYNVGKYYKGSELRQGQRVGVSYAIGKDGVSRWANDAKVATRMASGVADSEATYRDLSICRQTALKAAVEYVNHTEGLESPDPEQVIKIAGQFEAYLTRPVSEEPEEPEPYDIPYE